MTIFTWSEFDVNPSLVAFLFAASGFLLLLAGVCVVSVLFFAVDLQAKYWSNQQVYGKFHGLVDRDQACLPNYVEEAEEDGD